MWPPKSKTLGGYSKTMIIHWKFAILIPKTFPLEMAGPVMCAGEGESAEFNIMLDISILQLL